MGHRQMPSIPERKLQPSPNETELNIMQLHQPATDALKRSLMLHRRSRSYPPTKMELPCPRFATVGVGSRRNSSSNDDDGDTNNVLSIRYLEQLSIHQDNPASRGLVRSMSVHEGLCDLILHEDSSYFPETINTIPASGSYTLQAAINPLTPAPLLDVDMKNGEDKVAFNPARIKKPSSTPSLALIY